MFILATAKEMKEHQKCIENSRAFKILVDCMESIYNAIMRGWNSIDFLVNTEGFNDLRTALKFYGYECKMEQAYGQICQVHISWED